jgi:hypothetical protein
LKTDKNLRTALGDSWFSKLLSELIVDESKMLNWRCTKSNLLG